MDERFLYVMAAASEGPVKIGLSHQPEQRLRQLQTGHADRLCLFYAEAVDSTRAPLLERLLHRDIRHHRQIGEWFALSVTEAIGYVQFTIIEYALEPDLKRCLRLRW